MPWIIWSAFNGAKPNGARDFCFENIKDFFLFLFASLSWHKNKRKNNLKLSVCKNAKDFAVGWGMPNRGRSCVVSKNNKLLHMSLADILCVCCRRRCRLLPAIECQVNFHLWMLLADRMPVGITLIFNIFGIVNVISEFIKYCRHVFLVFFKIFTVNDNFINN